MTIPIYKNTVEGSLSFTDKYSANSPTTTEAIKLLTAFPKCLLQK